MKIAFLQILILVLSFYGCQDKGRTVSEENLVPEAELSAGDFEAIHLLPGSATLSAGRTVLFEVLGLLPYGTTRILNAEGSWSVSSDVVELVDGTPGQIRALKA